MLQAGDIEGVLAPMPRLRHLSLARQPSGYGFGPYMRWVGLVQGSFCAGSISQGSCSAVQLRFSCTGGRGTPQRTLPDRLRRPCCACPSPAATSLPAGSAGSGAAWDAQSVGVLMQLARALPQLSVQLERCPGAPPPYAAPAGDGPC